MSDWSAEYDTSLLWKLHRAIATNKLIFTSAEGAIVSLGQADHVILDMPTGGAMAADDFQPVSVPLLHKLRTAFMWCGFALNLRSVIFCWDYFTSSGDNPASDEDWRYYKAMTEHNTNRGYQDDWTRRAQYMGPANRKDFWEWLEKEEDPDSSEAQENGVEARTQVPTESDQNSRSKRSAQAMDTADEVPSARKKHQGNPTTEGSLAYHLAIELAEAPTPSTLVLESPQSPTPNLYMSSNSTPLASSQVTPGEDSPLYIVGMHGPDLAMQLPISSATPVRSSPSRYEQRGASPFSASTPLLVPSDTLSIEPDKSTSNTMMQLRAILSQVGHVPLLQVTTGGKTRTCRLPDDATHLLVMAVDLAAETPCTLVHLDTPTPLKNPATQKLMTFRTLLYCWTYGQSCVAQYWAIGEAWNWYCASDGPQASEIELLRFGERRRLIAWLAGKADALEGFDE